MQLIFVLILYPTALLKSFDSSYSVCVVAVVVVVGVVVESLGFSTYKSA